MNATMTFEFEKETPGAVRYRELGDNPSVRTMYFRKDAFADRDVTGYPTHIEVTVKEV